MANWSPKDFKKLKDQWYKKLKEEGFEDIEHANGRLKHAPVDNPVDYLRLLYSGRPEYYELATRFLNEYDFDNELERIIWEYHTNGLSRREIFKVLDKVKVKKVTGKPLGQTRIGYIIKRLSTEMKKCYVIGYKES